MHLMRPPVLPVDYTQQNAESRPDEAGFLRYRVSWSLLCRSFSVLGRRIPGGRSAAAEMAVSVRCRPAMRSVRVLDKAHA